MGRKSDHRAPPGRLSLVSAVAAFVLSFAGGVGAAAVFRYSAEPAPARSSQPEPGGASDAAAAETAFQRGVELLGHHETSAALAAFERAAALDRTDPRPWHGMGKIYEQLFLKDKAEECYRRAVAVDPAFRPSREKLAMVLHEKGKHAEAIAVLQELARETPNEPFVLGELAINALALGRAAEAVELLLKYRAARPQDAWGYAHLGKAYADSGRGAEAEAEYRRALELDRHLAVAHWWLGQLLVAAGREAEAAPFADRYRRLRQLATDEHQLAMGAIKNPRDLGTLVGLARVQLLQGKIAPSRATLERARALAPDDPRVIELDGIHARIPGPAPRR